MLAAVKVCKMHITDTDKEATYLKDVPKNLDSMKSTVPFSEQCA